MNETNIIGFPLLLTSKLIQRHYIVLCIKAIYICSQSPSLFLTHTLIYHSFESRLPASGCQSLSALIMPNHVSNRKEFVSPALFSSLAGVSTSNHLSLQPSDPQLSFVHRTSSSLSSAVIACERCPLWFCLHAKVLSGKRVSKSVTCVCLLGGWGSGIFTCWGQTRFSLRYDVSITNSEDISAVCQHNSKE